MKVVGQVVIRKEHKFMCIFGVKFNVKEQDGGVGTIQSPVTF